MADRKQNRRNTGKDDDFNPKFRKMRKKVWENLTKFY